MRSPKNCKEPESTSIDTFPIATGASLHSNLTLKYEGPDRLILRSSPLTHFLSVGFLMLAFAIYFASSFSQIPQNVKAGYFYSGLFVLFGIGIWFVTPSTILDRRSGLIRRRNGFNRFQYNLSDVVAVQVIDGKNDGTQRHWRRVWTRELNLVLKDQRVNITNHPDDKETYAMAHSIATFLHVEVLTPKSRHS